MRQQETIDDKNPEVKTSARSDINCVTARSSLSFTTGGA